LAGERSRSCIRHVRFNPQSGHSSVRLACLLWAKSGHHTYPVLVNHGFFGKGGCKKCYQRENVPVHFSRKLGDRAIGNRSKILELRTAQTADARGARFKVITGIGEPAVGTVAGENL
jgi:hypothetical protein